LNHKSAKGEMKHVWQRPFPHFGERKIDLEKVDG
jgi:hypothetical protein